MKQNIINQILDIKKSKNAVILAHYYAPGEVQAVADFVGDSFYLAKIAKSTNADILVFCGVYFMGESAKILNPDKKVLMPDIKADCPMAHMVEDGKIAEMRAKYDNLAVVCYINSSAELKAKSDVCVTSSNALKIVQKLPNKNIFFIPDKNLGSFIAEQVPEKNVILNNGYCPIHVKITLEDLQNEVKKHPSARVLSHPECNREVLENSDYIGSTADIIKYANDSTEQEFIICTENGVDFKLASDNPEKHFYFPEKEPCCSDMKLNTLEKVLDVLKTENNEIELDALLSQKAAAPLEKMLEMAK